MHTEPLLTDQQLIEALNSTKVATAIHIGQNAIIRTANQAMLKVWGKDKSVIGKSLEEALPELKGQPFLELFRQVWREGITISGKDTPAKLEIEGKLQTFYFDFEYKAVKDAFGRTVCILHTAIDVTEQFFSKQREQNLAVELAQMNAILQATNEELAIMNEEFAASNEKLTDYQQKLQTLNAELLESKTQLQFAIDAAELATWDYDPETGYFSGNGRLKEWFGLRQEDDISLAEAIHVIVPAQREKVVSAIQEAMHYSSGGTYDVEYELIHPASRVVRVIRAKGKALFNSSGQPVRMSGTVQDITEQTRREQYKDDFISIASHELKTPITSLKASLQLLNKLKEKTEPAVASKLIEQACRSMERTSTLVEDLLNASRIGAGQLHLNKSTFNVAQMLQGCCEHVRAAGKHKLFFQGEDHLLVYADQHRVDQVVINMINNAVKYAPDSGEIYLLTEKAAGDYVKISVKDNGPGIAEDKIPHLFERYYRSDYQGVQFSGIGLGLYISAEIIRKHGGEIGVESQPGKGSTFWFTLAIPGDLVR